MARGTIFYGLLTGLAIALLVAAFTDVRRRQIDNGLNSALALAAPLFWWASGLSLWPGIPLQFGLAVAAFAIGAGLFALRVLGGGDVKLLAALALWLPWPAYLELVLAMALLGGVLALLLLGRSTLQRPTKAIEVPYGVAIAGAGLWVIARACGSAGGMR